MLPSKFFFTSFNLVKFLQFNSEISVTLSVTFTGSCLLAALGLGRNVVAVEKDRWQFLHSQMRVVNSLSESGSSEATEELKRQSSDLAGQSEIEEADTAIDESTSELD